MSGLTSNNEYGHLEIEWTYTRPEHKHKGYMQELFTKMLNGVYESVYCSCWRLPNNDKVKLFLQIANNSKTSYGFNILS